MKKIYICGKISGMPFGEAEKDFQEAEEKLKDKYPEAELVNPIKLCKKIASQYRLPAEIFEDWYWCMTVDFAELLSCDSIYLIAGWQSSEGAKIEEAIARVRKMNFLS